MANTQPDEERLSLTRLVERWRHFVSRVEEVPVWANEASEAVAFDYHAGISRRSEIESAWADIGSSYEGLIEDVLEADLRFAAASVIRNPLIETEMNHWWRWCLPANWPGVVAFAEAHPKEFTEPAPPTASTIAARREWLRFVDEAQSGLGQHDLRRYHTLHLDGRRYADRGSASTAGVALQEYFRMAGQLRERVEVDLVAGRPVLDGLREVLAADIAFAKHSIVLASTPAPGDRWWHWCVPRRSPAHLYEAVLIHRGLHRN